MEITQIIQIFGIIIASSGLWGLISKIYENHHKEKTDKPIEKLTTSVNKLVEDNSKQWKAISALQDGNKALLHDRYIQLCTKIIEQGYITESQAELLDSLRVQYEANGLNGWGKKLYDRATNLPLKKGE